MPVENEVKNALIITAHPTAKSLSHSLSARIAGHLREQGTAVEMADLYAESFSPSTSQADLDLYHGNNVVPADIQREHQRVGNADMLVFVFPIYWWSVPGLLKGWFDRVLTLNWAYKVAEDGRIVGNLRDVPVRLVATGGSDQRGFDRHGYTTAIQTQIVEGVFGFCGLKDVKLNILYQADTATPEQVESFVENLKTVL